jgi:hypothetical protein
MEAEDSKKKVKQRDLDMVQRIIDYIFGGITMGRGRDKPKREKKKPKKEKKKKKKKKK